MAAEGESIGRCDESKPGEATSGGNGLQDHDETSKTLATSFELLTTPSPGEANSCS